jgi:proline iminopeptidase
VDLRVAVEGGTLVGHTGDGRGPDLLLLHGGPGLSDYTAILLGECDGWRTSRYTQRGLAPSTTAGPCTLDRHVRDARAVVAGLDRPVVLGHSWGGFLACALAVADPTAVAGLVLVDTLGLSGDGGVSAMSAELVRRRPPPPGLAPRDELAHFFPAHFADPEHAPAPFPVIYAAGPAEEAQGSVEECWAAGGLLAPLAATGLPAELVHGIADPLPPSVSEQIAAAVPQARLQVVAHAGHFPFLERPGCVRDALTRLRDRIG